MKFDVAIMNPPYNGTLHLQILEKVIPHCEKVVNISPIRWLQDPYAKYKKHSAYLKFEESISSKIDNLTIVPASKAQAIFNSAIFAMDLGIYEIGTGGFDYASISTNSIIEKVLKLKHRCKFDKNKKDGWRVRICEIGGGKSGGHGQRKVMLMGLPKLQYFYNGMKDGRPWHEWFRKNQYSKTTDTITCSVKFPSEQSCINFIDSLDTKFGKYVMSKLLTDSHIYEYSILYVSDYSQPWTDERFYEYFGLTQEEIDIIETTMKDYV